MDMAMFKPLKRQRLFRDEEGHTAVWQWPNLPLWGWLGCRAVAFLLPAGHLKMGSSQLGTAFLFTWAYLEITDGDSIFRRVLGVVVMTWIIAGFYRAV
jgi:hypothetical protein